MKNFKRKKNKVFYNLWDRFLEIYFFVTFPVQKALVVVLGNSQTDI